MTDGKPIAHGTTRGYMHGKCRCESCCDANREYQRGYRQRNKVRIAETSKRWRADNADRARATRLALRTANKERIAAQTKAYRVAHWPEIQAYLAKYNAEHRDERRRACLAWRDRDPEHYRLVKNRALLKRRRNAETFTITAKDWTRLVDRCGGSCFYCGCVPERLTIDHMIPISRGGHHAIGNVAPACHACNSSKKDKTPMEFRMYRSRIGVPLPTH